MNTALFELDDMQEAVEPIFARHETFHPRYGWLKKGFDAAKEMPDVFLRDDATTILGVGKNMVRAIRYWCTAFKVLSEVPNPDNPRLRNAVPTVFGERLLSDDGWDPYIEDAGSLWLLHWQLLSPPSMAPSWFAIFNELDRGSFTEDLMISTVRTYCEGQHGWPEPVDNSIKKDMRCILRMYANATSGRDLAEDSADSPFLDLDLVRAVPGEKGHYSFSLGPKGSLPSAILAYACFDFAGREGSASVISLDRLTRGSSSPGRLFKLTESEIAETLSLRFREDDRVELADVAGARQLVWTAEAAGLAAEQLQHYYANAESGVLAPS
jgi:hypothetical protein